MAREPGLHREDGTLQFAMRANGASLAMVMAMTFTANGPFLGQRELVKGTKGPAIDCDYFLVLKSARNGCNTRSKH